MIALLAASLLVAAPAKPRMVVLDTQDVSGKDPTLARVCTQILVAEATSDGRFSVVSSAEISQILGVERQRQLLGCGESGCLAELGGALGADHLLSSQLARVGTRFRLDLRLLDARKATTVVAAGDFVDGTEDGAAVGAQRLARELLARFSVGRPSAPAPSAAVVTSPAQGPTAPSRAGPALILAASGVVLAGAAVTTVLASKNYGDLKTAATGSRDTYDAASSKQKTLNLVADVLWAGGLAGAGVGSYLWFSAAPSAGGGGEVAVGGRF